MRFVMVTGMSGAGKTAALKMLEDAGYFCVDNLPILLMDKFTHLIMESVPNGIEKVAVGVDIRSGQAISQLKRVLEGMTIMNVAYEILFLEAEDEVLLKRYKESRRNHPLSNQETRVEKAIIEERAKLEFLKETADYIIDTSRLLTRELKGELNKIFVDNQKFNNLMISILSFGFKYGIPGDADLVFDVRFLPNPYYLDEMRNLTGNDPPVWSYVMGFDAARDFLEKLKDMMMFLIPNYILEGKNQLVIGIGCTGGKHRSVTLSNELFKILKNVGDFGVSIEHRDITIQ